MKLEKVLEFGFRLLEIFRPKFYNKITWVVVISGLGIISTTLLEKIIFIIFDELLDLTIIGENDTQWGMALVCIGLFYNFCTNALYEFSGNYLGRKKSIKQDAHDRRVFRKSQKILSGEELLPFINVLQNDHSYMGDKHMNILALIQYLDNDDNKFLNLDVGVRTKEYIDLLADLIQFTSYNFFVYPPNQMKTPFRYCMYPDLNVDRSAMVDEEDMKKYAEYTRELDGLAREVRKAHAEWRDAVKRNLVI